MLTRLRKITQGTLFTLGALLLLLSALAFLIETPWFPESGSFHLTFNRESLCLVHNNQTMPPFSDWRISRLGITIDQTGLFSVPSPRVPAQTVISIHYITLCIAAAILLLPALILRRLTRPQKVPATTTPPTPPTVPTP